jgi:hypothetical protein
MAMQQLAVPEQFLHSGRRATGLVLLGGLCGLAWAAGLRGFMAQIARSESTVDWGGTFRWILLPGLVVGMFLGWAEHLRKSGGRRGWRWLALSPLLFSAILFSRPLDMLSIFEDGVGGGRGRRSAVRHGGRLRAVGQGATLGTHRQCCRRVDHHPDLGADGDVLRRTRPRDEHRARRLGRHLLLRVPGGPHARLCHSPPTSLSTTHCSSVSRRMVQLAKRSLPGVRIYRDVADCAKRHVARDRQASGGTGHI